MGMMGNHATNGNGLRLKWLSDMDSNHDKELQKLLCYHYTIGQQRRLNYTMPWRFGRDFFAEFFLRFSEPRINHCQRQ